MAHAEWALKFKTKGTKLRNIRGRYYLYRISSKYDKERKVTRKITHEMLGRITEQDSFIPKGARRQAKEKQLSTASVKEFGATNFLHNIGKDLFDELAITFPELWK